MQSSFSRIGTVVDSYAITSLQQTLCVAEREMGVRATTQRDFCFVEQKHLQLYNKKTFQIFLIVVRPHLQKKKWKEYDWATEYLKAKICQNKCPFELRRTPNFLLCPYAFLQGSWTEIYFVPLWSQIQHANWRKINYFWFEFVPISGTFVCCQNILIWLLLSANFFLENWKPCNNHVHIIFWSCWCIIINVLIII